MKIKLFVLITLILFLFFPTASDDFFSGTWCIGNERLVITFEGSDSLLFYSKKDESINGTGKYEKTDSTLFSTVTNDELELNMGYRYKKQDESKLKAKFLFFVINGDSVNYPRRWLRMERCDPDTFSFRDEDSTETSDSEE